MLPLRSHRCLLVISSLWQNRAIEKTYLQPVAVESILVRGLDLEELWDLEIAKGPYPTERLAEVDAHTYNI